MIGQGPSILIVSPLILITFRAVCTIPFLVVCVCICVLTKSKGATTQATQLDATPPDHHRGRRNSRSSVSASTLQCAYCYDLNKTSHQCGKSFSLYSRVNVKNM